MKKNKLFEDKEMSTIQLETIRLYEPNQEALEHYKRMFDRYTVPELKAWVDNLFPLLKHKKIEVFSKDETLVHKADIEYVLTKKREHVQNRFSDLVGILYGRQTQHGTLYPHVV